MSNLWPRQSECDKFYGNPRAPGGAHVGASWYKTNIVYAEVPAALRPMRMGGVDVTLIPIHRKCYGSLLRVLNNPAIEADPGARLFSGSFCFRLMRGGDRLSMHAYGCAVDFDAAHNPFHSTEHRFQADSPLVKAFKDENWIWGGDWTHPDAMHFQAARI